MARASAILVEYSIGPKTLLRHAQHRSRFGHFFEEAFL